MGIIKYISVIIISVTISCWLVIHYKPWIKRPEGISLLCTSWYGESGSSRIDGTHFDDALIDLKTGKDLEPHCKEYFKNEW